MLVTGCLSLAPSCPESFAVSHSDNCATSVLSINSIDHLVQVWPLLESLIASPECNYDLVECLLAVDSLGGVGQRERFLNADLVVNLVTRARIQKFLRARLGDRAALSNRDRLAPVVELVGIISQETAKQRL